MCKIDTIFHKTEIAEKISFWFLINKMLILVQVVVLREEMLVAHNQCRSLHLVAPLQLDQEVCFFFFVIAGVS